MESYRVRLTQSEDTLTASLPFYPVRVENLHSPPIGHQYSISIRYVIIELVSSGPVGRTIVVESTKAH